jgi:hydrogenase nickel incorporation protein HypA/HybF
MNDLIGKIEATAQAEGGARVTRIRVRLGALSHFTPDHFRAHFEDASHDTVAEGAAVEAELGADPTEPEAQSVVLESIDVESVDSIPWPRQSARSVDPRTLRAPGGVRLEPMAARPRRQR